jgi:1-acyl-sn-glycerol-3-phosphate acyltransferase
MDSANPLRRLARVTPAPLDGLVEYGAGALNDLEELVDGLPDDPLEAWDPEHIRRTLPWLRTINSAYFRPDVRGLENVPPGGPALLVGNHSGGLVIADTFVFAAEFYDHFGPDRRFHQLAHDVAAKSPVLGLIRRYGVVPASHDNARAAFKLGAPVLVYPGGDYETFRPSWHGDQIEFGGRQGFIRLALEENVPIVPVVSIGGQETALFLTRGQRAAKLIGLDRVARIKVLPVSIGPPLGINFLDLPGRLPLPAKITIQVLPPIDLRERFGEDPDRDEVYEQVTAEMQQALTDLSEERTLPVVG